MPVSKKTRPPKPVTSQLVTAIKVGTSVFKQRAGQLICNVIDTDEELQSQDLFYIEDDKLAQAIYRYIDKYRAHAPTTIREAYPRKKDLK